MRKRYNDYDYEDEYDDEGYEDYGELGSNYEPDDDQNWGYDNYDGYDEWEDQTYAPNNRSPRSGNYDRNSRRNEGRAPSRLDFSNAVTSSLSLSRSSNIDTQRGGKAPSSIDFSDHNRWDKSGDELSQYLDYIERYDNGEIDNHDMSRVQRRFANKSFWDTFQPSEQMIREYGRGNKSTKWPLFERKAGRWSPIIWRND